MNLAGLLYSSLDSSRVFEYPYLLNEVKAEIANFDYEKSSNDPTPRVIVFGRWQHPNTGTTLVCGINLNYLSKSEKLQVLKSADAYLDDGFNTKEKYDAARNIIPEIMKKAYRTYDEEFIINIKIKEIDIPTSRPEPEEVPEPKVEPKEVPEPKTELEPQADNEIEKIKAVGDKLAAKHNIDDLAAKIRDLMSKDTPDKQTVDKQDIVPDKEPGATKEVDKVEKIAGDPDGEVGELEKVEKATVDSVDVDKLEKVADDPDGEVEELEKIDDADDVDELEDIAGDPDGEVEELEKIDKLKEGWLANTNAIVDAYTFSKPHVMWKSPKQFEYWHKPENAFEHRNALHGSIIDCDYGDKFAVVYNTITESFVVGRCYSDIEFTSNIGWYDDDDLIVLISDGKSVNESYDPINVNVYNAIRKSAFGLLIDQI